MDFFGLATLSRPADLDSDGDFTLSLSGRMTLGSDDFGLRGDFSIYMESTFDADDTTGATRFELGGSAPASRCAPSASRLAGVGLGFSTSASHADRDARRVRSC